MASAEKSNDPRRRLIEGLRATALRLADGARFQWSSFANCNCGNLVQEVMRMRPEEIQWATYPQGGDWASQAEAHCRSTGLPADVIFDTMESLGMKPRDFRQLERLSNPDVLKRIPDSDKPLRHTQREHSVLYMRAWADVLEESLSVDGCFEEDPSEESLRAGGPLSVD